MNNERDLQMITLHNIHTNATITAKLVSHKFTWQNIWVISFNGVQETVTNTMGWCEVK